MNARARAFDWASTPLGSFEKWSLGLRTGFGLCLNAGFPAALHWGPKQIIIYNDAWKPFAGDSHPTQLGRSAWESRPIAGDSLAAVCEQVRQSGKAHVLENQLLCVSRHGILEECYFNFTFNPVPDDTGLVGGVLIAATDTTTDVISKRRGHLLHELARLTATAASTEQVCTIASDVFGAGQADIPFCLTYLFDGDASAHLAGITGLQAETAASPSIISLKQPGGPWPLRRIWTTGRAEIVADVGTRFGLPLSGGLWPEPARITVLAPISGLHPGRPAGVMLAGVSPRRPLDDSYSAFIERAASQLSIAIGRARSPFEQRRRWVRHRQRRALFSADTSDFHANSFSALPVERPRVLVASSDATTRSTLQMQLSNDYNVETAAEASDVLQYIEARQIDLVLCDASASLGDALDLLAEIHAHEVARTLPVIVLSTESTEDERIAALESGADDFLAYPASTKGLLTSVAHTLKLSALRREAAAREAYLRQRAQMLHDRLNTIVENMPVGAALMAPDGRVIHANPAFRRYLTRSDPPFCDITSSWSALDTDGQPMARSNYPRARALRGEIVHNQPFMHHPPGQPARHTLVSAIPIHDEDDEVTSVISIIVDNDAAVRSSMALADSEAKLTAVFNSATVGLAQADPDGRFTLVNDRYCKTVGRSREELLNLRMQDITHPDDQAENTALFERIAETGASSIIEHRYLRPDGSIIWVQNSVSLVHDAAGHTLGTLAATVDISEHKRAEAQITLLAEDSRSRREEREALLRALPVGVFIAHNAQGTQITTNPAGAAILGITANANASKTGPTGNSLPFRVLKDGIEVPGDQLPMQRASKLGQPVMGEELDIQFTDGKVTNLYEYAVPLRDSAGTVRGCIGVFVDITARKQAELRQKLLLNELNHRVKNTLAIVQSIAAQTLREIPEPRAFKQAFSARLMTLSRAHNLLTRTAWQGAPLGDVVAAALAPFHTDSHSQFHVQGPTVLLEPNSAVTLSLALHELATNAAKYGALSKLAGRVRVVWSITDAAVPGGKPMVEFSWVERSGPAVRPPERRGFGTRLVEASAEQLGGRITLEYKPEGFECRCVLPLPDIPAAEVLPAP
ncbi:PAS domain S-box protein [Leptospira interrogans]